MYDLLSESTPATQAIPPTDGERLMRFVRHRDEDAFSEVVEAHATLVWSVCWQILKQRQDAEDAFQATFLILARKAHTIKANDSAAAWLYRVAFRTALRLKERRRREASLVEQQLSEESLVANEQLDAVAASEQTSALMEELHALPDRYQRPLILHYLEAKSRSAIAEELGCSTSAIKGRLGRARGMLRSRLARRGVALSAAMAVTATAFETSAATLPVALPTGTAGLALAFRTKLPLPDGTQVVGSLAQKGITAMTVATMMKPAAGVLAVVLAAVLLTQVNAEEEQKASPAAAPTLDLLAQADAPAANLDADLEVQPQQTKPAVWNETKQASENYGGSDEEGGEIITGEYSKESGAGEYTSRTAPISDQSAPVRNAPTYTGPPAIHSIKMSSDIEPLPAGGKKQLELELKYWELKAEALDQRSQAEEAERVATLAEQTDDKEQVAKYRRKAIDAQGHAQSMMSRAESYLARSKKAELEGRLKQLERLEKLEKNPPVPAPATPNSLRDYPILPRAEPQPIFDPIPRPVPPPNNSEGDKISPGDKLRIEAVSGDGSNVIFDTQLTVESMGTVALGAQYGRVKVSGKSLLEAEQETRKVLSEVLKEPKVQVTRVVPTPAAPPLIKRGY